MAQTSSLSIRRSVCTPPSNSLVGNFGFPSVFSLADLVWPEDMLQPLVGPVQRLSIK
jgi:hypothetical protein